jgi:hypothetical protein
MNTSNTSLLAREPVAITNAVFAVIQAGLTLLLAFNVITLTDTQSTALLGFLNVLFALFNIIFVRSKVTPVADPRNDQGQPLVSVNATQGALNR